MGVYWLSQMGQDKMVLVQKLETLGKGKSVFSSEAKGCELAALLYGSLDRAGSSTNEYDKGRTHPATAIWPIVKPTCTVVFHFKAPVGSNQRQRKRQLGRCFQLL